MIEVKSISNRIDLIPAALYARVSSDRQDVDLSVAAQLRALREYAERNGYSIAREYVDEAESGRISDRPHFHEIMSRPAGTAPSLGPSGKVWPSSEMLEPKHVFQ